MPRLVQPHSAVADFADAAFRAGVRVPEVLRRAQIPGSTWMRWLRGAEPKLGTLGRLNDALTAIIEEDRRHGAESRN